MRNISVKLFFNLDQWFKRRRLRRFLIWGSGVPFAQLSQTICEILVKVIMRNIYAK